LKRLIEPTSDAQIFSEDIRQRIYETAEANPFVMEWIVAQVDAAQEPDAVLEELKQGEGDAAERVFDRSFTLPQLGDDGRDVLLALSLFAPSATREALGAVAGFEDDTKRLNDSVRNLHALWLIKGIDKNSRFTIEGLTRTLAGARLYKDERATDFRQRFVTYFQHYIAEHAHPTPEDYAALEVERDNLLGVMDMVFNVGDWKGVLEIVHILTNPNANGLLYIHGYWDEAIRRGQQAVKAAQMLNDEWAIAQFAANAAVIRVFRGEYDEARLAYQKALDAFKSLGSNINIAVVLHQLGVLAQKQGELEEAYRLYHESLEIKKKLGDQSLVASTLHQLGRLAQIQGDLEEARKLYDESLEINKSLGNQSGIAATLHQLGKLTEIQGDLEKSMQLYEESLKIDKKLGNQNGISISLYELGRLAQEHGDLAEAQRLYSEALSIFERLGSPYAEVTRRNLERITGES
jgi:tetratricopeptide (TPR) repeat protein